MVRAMGLITVVLAASHDVSLLRTAQPGLALSCLLPTAVLASPRGVIRPIPGALFMASLLRHDLPPAPFAVPLASVPGNGAVVEPCVHMEPAESGDAAQLPGDPGVHSAVFAVGIDGVQPCCARDRAQG